jgi:O-antigen/teichoic acid export membrane protein
MKKISDIIGVHMPTKKLWRGLKNASYLTIGHFFSMIISFLGFIFIARLLGPSDYGIYVTVGAFVGLFNIFTLGGLNKVILREGAKDLDQMGYYLEKTTGIKTLFTFSAISLCIISSFFMPYPFQEKLYIIVFSSILIFRSFHGFFGTVYQASEKMQYNSALAVLNNILFVTISITFLYMGFGLLSVIITSLFSHFFTLIINFKLTRRFLIFKFWNKIKWDKSLLKPALIFSILSFTFLLTTEIDLIMISWLSSPKDVGIYGVAYQITSAGAGVRNILAVAFFPIFVKTFYKNVVKWKNLLKYAFLLGFGLLLISTVGSLLSEQVITSIFGMEYSESSMILSVLIFYLAITFFTIPFTNTIQATHNESNILKVCWVGPCLNIGLNILFFRIFGLIGIAYSTLIVRSVTLSITVFIAWFAVKKHNELKKSYNT